MSRPVSIAGQRVLPWDGAKHKDLLVDLEKKDKELEECSGSLHDIYHSDGFNTKPHLGAKYTLMQARHGQLTREKQMLESEIASIELSKPSDEVQRDSSARDVIRRFIRKGYSGLEGSEIKDFEPEQDFKLSKAEGIDLAKVFSAYGEGRDSMGRVQNTKTTQIVSDEAISDTQASVQESVQIDVMNNVVDRLKFFGGPARMSYQFDTPSNTRPIKFPQLDDTVAGEIQKTQKTQASEESFDLPAIDFKAYRASSKFLDLSLEAVDDLGLDIEGVIRRCLVRRLGRAWDNYFTNDTDHGLLNMIGDDKKVTITAAQAANNFDLVWEDMIDVQYKIDRAYRMVGEGGEGGFQSLGMGQVGYMLADDMERRIKLMKDNDGRPLWLPTNGSSFAAYPGTIFGHPYVVMGSAPAPLVKNTAVVLWGNFSYYGIRNAGDPMLFRFFDSATASSYSARFLGFSWRGAQSIMQKYGPSGAEENEWLAAIYAGNA